MYVIYELRTLGLDPINYDTSVIVFDNPLQHANISVVKHWE